PRPGHAAEEDRERAALEVEQATTSRRLVARIGQGPGETQAGVRSMSLQRYREKRDFRLTPEPRGRVARGKAKALSFVIQKHAARRLQYDFRLELDGVLLSWAVPKGPSLNPQDTRLATHVEDHPIEYRGCDASMPR